MSAQASDCDALMARVAVGDRQAFAALFDLEAGRLIAIADRIVRRRDLAEEVVQDTFVTVWRKAALYDARRGAARAWITTMARHRALNIVRDAARVDHHDATDLATIEERARQADHAYDALPESEDLRRCLGELAVERRRSIVMAYVAGFSHGEIAAALGAPVGTVKAWIRRGVVALKACLS